MSDVQIITWIVCIIGAVTLAVWVAYDCGWNAALRATERDELDAELALLLDDDDDDEDDGGIRVGGRA